MATDIKARVRLGIVIGRGLAIVCVSLLLVIMTPFLASAQFGGGFGGGGSPSGGSPSGGSPSGGPPSGGSPGGGSPGGGSPSGGSPSGGSPGGGSPGGFTSGSSATESDSIISGSSGMSTISTGESLTISSETLSIISGSPLSAGQSGAAIDLTIEDSVSIGRYSDIYLANGQTVLVDNKTRTFSNLGMPYGQPLAIHDLSKGIRRIANSDIGETLYRRNVELTSRALIALPAENAGAVALVFSQYGDLIPDNLVSSVFHFIAVSPHGFISESKDIGDQVDTIVRLLEMSPSAFTPDPDSPVEDPALPPFPLPREIWPFAPLDYLIDPRTGLNMPWLPLVEEADKQERERQEVQRKLEETMSDMRVNVVLPLWLIDVLPKNDPHLPSEVTLRSNGSEQVDAVEILRSWCSPTSDPMDVALDLERNNADVLVIEGLADVLRTDSEIRDCLSSEGLLQAPVAQQVLAFEGSVPFTRLNFGSAWSAGHLAASLAGLQRSDAPDDSVTVPLETLTIKERETQCNCVQGDPETWIMQLLGGWLEENVEHCLSSPGGDPRVRCAGKIVEVAPPVEVSLVSLEGGTPEPSLGSQTLITRDRSLEQFLCAIDDELECIPFQLYTTLSVEDFQRFVGRMCERGLKDNSDCTSLTRQRHNEVFISPPTTLLSMQRSDLIKADGTGIFFLPLGAVLFQSRVGTNGKITTRLLEDVNDSAADKVKIEALRRRETERPFQSLTLNETRMRGAKPFMETLLTESNLFVSQISVVVHRDLLSQIAISSYVKHITREWTREDVGSSSLVPVSQLRE